MYIFIIYIQYQEIKAVIYTLNFFFLRNINRFLEFFFQYYAKPFSPPDAAVAEGLKLK